MTACKACGRPIHWAISPSGATIPLEQVYRYELEADLTDPPECGTLERVRAVRVEAPVFISHFLTCKDRDRFSGARKRSPDG